MVEKDDERPRTAEEKWERELKKGASATSAAKAPAKAAGKPVSAKAAAAAKAEKGAEKLQLEKERANRERVEAIRLRVLGTLQVLESILNGVVVSLDEDAREAFEMWMSRSIEADESCRKRECRCETWKERQEGTLPTDFESNWRSYLEGCGNGLGCCHIAFDGRGDFSSRDFRGSLQKRPFSCFDEAADGRQGRLRCIFPLIYYLLLRIGRTRNIKEKIRTELIIFGSEILISHCGLGGSPLVPGRSMVHVLIELLNTLPRLHGAAREGLLALCVSMEDSAADEEDEDPETLDESEKLRRKHFIVTRNQIGLGMFFEQSVVQGPKKNPNFSCGPPMNNRD
ncbi:hypothetical protein BJ741DRAFT_394694 [Chytriomyces cf. hyalinus JEL632]|nr:hypothetical protein BJ741DRAFT_394694 [Chytriomyces cf. hyalinus JEL632]